MFDEAGAAVIVSPGRRGSGPNDKGVVFVGGGPPLPKDAPRPLPQLIMSAEHYNRVMRILKETGAQPRRTIRAALWGSEEVGHYGSSAYVEQNFGGPDVASRLPDHDKMSVYFNMDWYGRFRGIFLQGNDLVRPIFEEWMEPFHDVGMTYLVPGNTGGSDHLDFIRAGLPGFQFIQDDLEFFSTNWHTNMEVYDRLVADDLMQASVILASWAYLAAMRDEMLPKTERQMKNNRRWHK